MDDAELCAQPERLMRRIEAMLTELLELGAEVRNLRSEHDATRQLVTALEQRLDKFEKPPE